MTDQSDDTQTARPVSINFAPASRITAPDITDWHLVADHELDSIAHPEGGVTGAIGFAGLGAALGAMPAGCTAIDSISSKANVSTESFRALLVMLPSLACAVICLIIWGVNKYRRRDLVAKIRARPRHGDLGSEREQN